MKLRITVSSCVVAAWLAAVGCSSGLGNNLPGSGNQGSTVSANPNLSVGLDVGLIPTDPVANPVVAGVVVPAIGTEGVREVVLVAFTTAASAADGDGLGSPLSRDSVADANGASDVFVAAVSAQDVETRAFSQSLAGKFRHPRCATCHSMQAADTQAFVSSPQPHAGPPPGPGFPNNAPEACADCHVTAATFPVPSWQAPAASFDFRNKTVAELAAAAANVPADESEHFVTDKRVLWALDSGILPQVGGRNGAADDDHDGVLEPEDTDGRPRPVPGGSATFLDQIEAWNDSGRVVTAASAVQDLTLVSRAAGGAGAGNGASSAPQVLWVPNPGFSAPGTLGTLFVVYQSDASDLVAGDTNGATDVFRTAVNLNADAAGNLDLVVVGDAVLCSATNGTTNEGNGASTRPVIGGADGEWIAFESLATDLVAGFTDNNGAAADVFVHNADTNETFLVSRAASDTAGGNGESARPAIDAAGRSVAFESDASDLVAGDANAARDVFVARTDGGPSFTLVRASVSDASAEATGGGSGHASVFTETGGRTLVAFQSDATNLATGLVATTNVFLFDSATGASTLLNQLVSPNDDAIGDGSARRPVIGADGSVVAFESDASNIDVLRDDENRSSDVFLVETAQLATGNVLPYRISMTTNEATDGNGSSTAPSFGVFTNSANYRVGFVAYTTAATNLGTPDSTDVMISFVDETSGVLAQFSATPVVGTAPLTVQFTDESSGSPTGWRWDFEDDGIVDSTEQNPEFTYTTPGLYSVELIASNANSEGTKAEASLVRVRGDVTADFSVSTTSGAVPLTVIFTDASDEPFGTISAWEWDFDDDGTVDSTQQNPSFDYTSEGTYTVKLTVTGEGGTATVTRTGLITVDPPGPITANFTSVRSGYNDQSIAFTDTSVGAVTDWLWNFGDGGSSTLQNPTHTFTTPGVYTVSLTASGFGVTDTETKPNWFTSVASSITVTIEPSQDTSIYSESTGNSNGANPQLVCGNAATLLAAQFGIRRALLEFDVAGSVDAGSTITAASLQLTCTYNPINPTGPQSVSLRRVTADWTEGTSNLAIGGGTPATGNDATWINRTSGTSPVAWSSAGGDFNATVSASTVVDTAGVYVWSSNANMISNVQLWLDTPAQNHGWILRAGETSGTRTAKVFGARENGVPADRPKLTITFTPPLP